MKTSRTALLLGASGTIGRAIATTLADQGYRLGLHACRHPERCPDLDEAQVFEADFRAPEAVAKLTKSFLAAFGPPDALVWAAGIVREKPVGRLGEVDLREVLAVDLCAPFLLAKHFARSFLKRKGGTFLVLSSHAAWRGRVGGAAYAMAQSGLLALVRSLAREWGPYGVRVNAVVPPFVAASAMGQTADETFSSEVAQANVLRSKSDPVASVATGVAKILDLPLASGQVFVLDSRLVPG